MNYLDSSRVEKEAGLVYTSGDSMYPQNPCIMNDLRENKEKKTKREGEMRGVKVV